MLNKDFTKKTIISMEKAVTLLLENVGCGMQNELNNCQAIAMYLGMINDLNEGNGGTE